MERCPPRNTPHARRRPRARLVSLLLAASHGPVNPNFGGSSSSFACERPNRLFCSGWVSRNGGNVLWPALRQHIVLTLVAPGVDGTVNTCTPSDAITVQEVQTTPAAFYVQVKADKGTLQGALK